MRAGVPQPPHGYRNQRRAGRTVLVRFCPDDSFSGLALAVGLQLHLKKPPVQVRVL